MATIWTGLGRSEAPGFRDFRFCRHGAAPDHREPATLAHPGSGATFSLDACLVI